MARKFFYICAGMFLLALSFHLGAVSASAQYPGNPVVAAWQATLSGSGASNAIVTANGDVFTSHMGPGDSWNLVGNVFGGGPVPALHESWGQVKARYRTTPGMTVTPGADDK